MISAATKAPYLRATTQVIGNGLKPAAAGVPKKNPIVVREPVAPLISSSISNTLPYRGVGVTTGIPSKYIDFILFLKL